MTIRAIRMALPAAALALTGCGWLPDAYTGCNEAQPYQAAEQREGLRVPAGADLPDTRNALKIPEVRSPELPRDPNSCLEHPPAYANERPQPPTQPVEPPPAQSPESSPPAG